jgi:tripartite-type tricarboxylate transporter receptor subunit TctC
MNWPTRLSTMPDVPTLEEVGVKGFEAGAEQAVLMPAGTPKDIVARLNKEIIAIMNTQAIKDRLEAVGVYPPVSRTPDELKAYVTRQAREAGVVIKKNGISIN